ncbi:MAG TPA: D-glycero-beta-D-manno-heptose 1-phosphate adenylyltransferase [Blastocatellia bacterium]|nr:D-glycero-beta-D-manno-heptose 1-phosphate adenylyltransferase [Blastocatellia bacterium]
MAKILSLDQLLKERERLRRQGRRVVFTNGCFDLIHPGHIRYLQGARLLGDALIVALNSDRSVRELKGENRPILDQDERAEVMAALSCVDYVTIFDESTPREIIAALLPDVLVKGGDWDIDRIIGRDEVEAAGGEVLSLPFVEGCSTTDLIERIVRLNCHRDTETQRRGEGGTEKSHG